MSGRSRSTCALVSGGLDSALLVHRLLARGQRVLPLYLRCGLWWERAELSWLRRYLDAIRTPALAPLLVVEMPLVGVYRGHWSLTGRAIPDARSADAAVYLPGRNVLLLTHAAIVCARRRCSTIALGILKGNPFGDASPRFLTQMATCLSQALSHPIRIVAPLRQFTKAQLVRAAADLPLALTFSCIRPDGRFHCGRCNKCAERQRAFRAAAVTDPTRYAYRGRRP